MFSKIHQGNERTHTCSVQKTFTTGARFKQPFYVCIGQRFGWEINFPLLSGSVLGWNKSLEEYSRGIESDINGLGPFREYSGHPNFFEDMGLINTPTVDTLAFH